MTIKTSALLALPLIAHLTSTPLHAFDFGDTIRKGIDSTEKAIHKSANYIEKKLVSKEEEKDKQEKRGDSNVDSTANTVSKTKTGNTIKNVQTHLNKMGYDVGPPDGIAGKTTKNAIKSFQRDNGFIEDGIPSKTLLLQLNKSLEKNQETKKSSITNSTKIQNNTLISTDSKRSKILSFNINSIKIGHTYQDVVAVFENDNRWENVNIPNISGNFSTPNISAVINTDDGASCKLNIHFQKNNAPMHIQMQSPTPQNPLVYQIVKECQFTGGNFPEYSRYLSKRDKKYGTPDYISTAEQGLTHIYVGTSKLSPFLGWEELYRECAKYIRSSGKAGTNSKALSIAKRTIPSELPFKDIDIIESGKPHPIRETCPELTQGYVRLLNELSAPYLSHYIHGSKKLGIRKMKVILSNPRLNKETGLRKHFFKTPADIATARQAKENTQNQLDKDALMAKKAKEKETTTLPGTAYGPNILDIQLGMPLETALDQLTTRYQSGWRYDLKSTQLVKNKGNILATNQNASIFISSDRKDVVSVYYEKDISNTILGISRYVVGPFPEDIDQLIMSKYGQPKKKRIESNFSSFSWNKYTRKQNNTCNIGRVSLMIPLSAKVFGEKHPGESNNRLTMLPVLLKDNISVKAGLTGSFSKRNLELDRVFNKYLLCSPTLQYYRESNNRGDFMHTWISDVSVNAKVWKMKLNRAEKAVKTKPKSSFDL